jgi:hypothetical protein
MPGDDSSAATPGRVRAPKESAPGYPHAYAVQRAGLPKWPRYDKSGRRVLHLDETIKDAADSLRPRYEVLDAYVAKQRGQ